MYANNIHGMNLYFIHLHYFTKVAHGDMCAFCEVQLYGDAWQF